MRKLLAAMCLPALAVIVLAGCGSSKKSTTASTSTSPGVNAAIAAQVPAAVKAKGTLIVASEAEYAPDEFIAPDGHTVIGMDPDMVKAIAAVMLIATMFGVATVIVRANAGLPGYARWQNLPANLTKGQTTEAGVDIEIMPGDDSTIKLIVPIRNSQGPGE